MSALAASKDEFPCVIVDKEIFAGAERLRVGGFSGFKMLRRLIRLQTWGGRVIGALSLQKEISFATPNQSNTPDVHSRR